jgi:hypothetical protein
LSDAASGQNPRRAKRRGWGGAAFAPCCSGFRAHYRLPFLASGTTSFQMPIGAYSAATSLPECRALYRPLRPFLDLRAVSPYCSPARTAPLIASPRSRCHTNPPIEDGRARTSVEGAGSSTSARISAASGIRCFSGLFLRVPHRDPPANALVVRENPCFRCVIWPAEFHPKCIRGFFRANSNETSPGLAAPLPA